MQAETEKITVPEEKAGQRLDAFLTEHIEGWSRPQLQKLIENGDVLVNDKPAKASYKLRAGDEIDIDLTVEPVARFEPENIPLDIVFEDEYLAVINKPAGMVVHPGAGVQSGTLANAIAWHVGQPGPDRSVPPASAGGRESGYPDLDHNRGVVPPAHAGGTDKQASAADHRVGIDAVAGDAVQELFTDK